MLKARKKMAEVKGCFFVEKKKRKKEIKKNNEQRGQRSEHQRTDAPLPHFQPGTMGRKQYNNDSEFHYSAVRQGLRNRLEIFSL